MSFVIAPHTLRLPIWVTAVCIGAGAWRWWIARRGLRTLPWWAMAIFAIGVTAAARLEYGRLFGREIGVTLLIAMLCLKLLEMKQKRDVNVVVFLGFFLAMTNFFYSQTIAMGAYLLLCVCIFVATLVGFNRIHSEATARERLIPAAWLVLQAIPLMLVMFFLFPRLSGPLWRMPSEQAASTGLSEEMTPGDISKLSQSEAIAFRVDFDAAVPNTEDLYWRGPVLAEQAGRSWRMLPPELLRDTGFEPQSAPISYRVTLQPSNKFWLFALDLPAIRPPNADLFSDFQLRSRTPVSSLQAYEMRSHLRYTAGATLTERDRLRHTRISPGINPRSVTYARELRAENPDPKMLIEKLMARYNREFEYTLEPPPLGPNPVDEFLFESKKGFCEHYASSFVFILRAAGIPARVVTGYQGGEVNPLTRQLVVRQSEAHAWAEVWFADLGWVRADPTFAVSPLRINRGMTEALGPIGVINSLMEADKFGFLKNIAFSWDAINSRWNQWVIGFNQDRQRNAMEMLFGMKDIDWRGLAQLMLFAMFLLGGLAAAILLWRSYRMRKEPVVAVYEALCAKLARAGMVRLPHEGPVDFLRRIETERPDLAPDARAAIDAYVALRYSPSDTHSVTLAHFRALTRNANFAKSVA